MMTITITWDDVLTILKYGAAFVAGGVLMTVVLAAAADRVWRR